MVSLLTESQLRTMPFKAGITWAMVINGALSSLNFGLTLAALNTTTNVIVQVMDWCEDGRSFECDKSDDYLLWLGPTAFLGALIGAACFSQIVKLGCMGTHHLQNACYIIGGILLAAAPKNSGGYPVLLLARLFGGFGIGIATAMCPIYLNELAHLSIRGVVGSFFQLFINTGLTLSVAIGLPIAQPDKSNPQAPADFESWYWRFVGGVPIIFAAIQSLLLFFVFRDPPAVGVIGNMDASTLQTPDASQLKGALRQLHLSYSPENAQLMFEDLKLRRAVTLFQEGALDSQGFEAITSAAPSVELVGQAAYDRMIAAQRGETSALTEQTAVRSLGVVEVITSKLHAWPMYLSLIMIAIQQLGLCNIIVAKSNSILEDADVAADKLSLFSFLLNLANVVVTLIMLTLVEKFGRKRLLQFSLTMQVILLAPACFGYWLGDSVSEDTVATLSVVSLVGFMLAFAMGAGPIVWLYIAEILVPEAAGATMSLCSLLNWTLSLILMFVSGVVGNITIFSTSFVAGAGGLILVTFLVRETAGKSVSPFYEHLTKADPAVAEKEGEPLTDKEASYEVAGQEAVVAK